VVEAFAAAGHPVLALGRHPPAGTPATGRVRYRAVDVAPLAATIMEAEAVWGPVDCVINVARGIDVLLEAVLPGMERRRHGTIVNIDPMGEVWQAAEAERHVRVIDLAPRPGRRACIAPAELAGIALYCYRLPQRICVRNLVVMPTGSDV
jgi:NADP-dependent 3-hydroxy acid dehydrogenase YdfG